MNKWEYHITKEGSEVYISNGKYNFLLGDAWKFTGNGFESKLDAKLQSNLIKDAKDFCKCLNKYGDK